MEIGGRVAESLDGARGKLLIPQGDGVGDEGLVAKGQPVLAPGVASPWPEQVDGLGQSSSFRRADFYKWKSSDPCVTHVAQKDGDVAAAPRDRAAIRQTPCGRLHSMTADMAFEANSWRR